MNDGMIDIGTWPRWADPASAGWSIVALAEAKTYAERLDTAAAMVVADA